MRSFLFLIFISFFTLDSNCQNNFNIDDVVPGGKSYKKYQPQLSRFIFSQNGKTIYLVDNNSVRIFDTNTCVAGKVLFDLDGINNALAQIGINSISAIPVFNWGINKELYFTLNNRLLFFDYNKILISSQHPIEKESNVDFSFKSGLFAYNYFNRLIVSNTERQLFSIGDSLMPDVSYGNIVSRNEFGIEKGTFWSPSGKYLLFYKLDETDIFKYPIIDYSQNPPSISFTHYPMAGTNNQKVSVGLLEVSSGKISYINSGVIADKYYTNITWSPDESSFYVAEVDRSQQNLEMVRYDLDNLEKGQVIFSENEGKYIEPQNGLFFIPKNSKEFLWLSRRDGYNHLFRYNTNGDVLRQLTKGNWEITDILGFTDDSKSIVFEGTKDGALDRQIYKLDINKGLVSIVSKTAGFHKGSLSNNGIFLLDQYSSKDIPGTIELYNFSSSLSRVISSAYNPLKKERTPKIEIVKIKASDDSTDLYGRMVTPPDFDAKKKYPVIIYVYGGPHSQLVNNKWLNGAPLWDLFMAQKGYIVFTLDNRGTSFRGKEFEQVTYLNLGENEMADQVKGVEYLKKLPYVDKKWIGVFGWSFGGFMAISLLENYPNIFKVGVAGGPVVDWSMYEIMYGERYMSTPQNNLEGYQKSCLLNKVENIEGKLLVIQGLDDKTVLYKHSMDFVQTCVDKRIQIDYFVYPNQEHNVVGENRVHLMEKITEYFDDYLR